MRGLPDNAFALAIADPPYGIGADHDQKLRAGTQYGKSCAPCKDYGNSEWDSKAPEKEWFDELRRVSRHQIIWGANFFDRMPPCKCFLTWVKTNIPDGFQMAQAEYAWTTLTCNARVWHGRSTRDQGSHHFHPTEKPVALYRWLLQVWLESIQIPKDEPLRVFDPMMGSQSSRIAAAAMQVDYYGCELDAEYFRQGCQRYDAEVRGITTRADGQTIQQLQLFDF
jgi:site-specific DNA-methyltransferase (adenine-specific)